MSIYYPPHLRRRGENGERESRLCGPTEGRLYDTGSEFFYSAGTICSSWGSTCRDLGPWYHVCKRFIV